MHPGSNVVVNHGNPKRFSVWAGWIASAVPILLLSMSAVMKLLGGAELLEMWVGTFGYPERALVPIALVELVCAIVYAFPKTAVLGAILVTGYLGGAIATHVRVGDPFILPLALGVVAWLGIYLRCGRLRAILPLRGDPTP